MNNGAIFAAVLFTFIFVWRVIYLVTDRARIRRLNVGKFVEIPGRPWPVKILSYHIIGDKYKLVNGEIYSWRTMKGWRIT